MCYVQLMLPEGIKRENNKMYEEVEIPPSDPMSIGFEEKPIYISELDEVRHPMVTCEFGRWGAHSTVKSTQHTTHHGGTCNFGGRMTVRRSILVTF